MPYFLGPKVQAQNLAKNLTKNLANDPAKKLAKNQRTSRGMVYSSTLVCTKSIVHRRIRNPTFEARTDSCKHQPKHM